MTISISRVRVTQIVVVKDSEGQVKISGNYELISEKGDIVAKQSFNGYNDMSFDFDKSIAKNFMEEVESTIEIDIGIINALKNLEEK